MQAAKHPASYRDPAGFVFTYNGTVYRQVQETYAPHYRRLHESGLHKVLSDKGLMLPFEEVTGIPTPVAGAMQTLLPQQLHFISHPYEWCFGMWQDAALATLDIMELALDHGMILKDASAFNLQWHQGKMMLIDHLSFEIYEAGKPWKAYRQFCEHFLAPLALMHYFKLPLQGMTLASPEGIPVDTASKMLPFKSRWHLHTYLHIHLQAKMKKRVTEPGAETHLSLPKLRQLLQSLRAAIKHYKFDSPTGVWSGYYDEAAERAAYLPEKEAIIGKWLENLPVKTVTDLGANEGRFSLLAAKTGADVVSVDGDHYSVNRLYHRLKSESVNNVHPLVMNLAHPSPAIGVNNEERAGFFERRQADLVLALALIHHLCIGSNISFEQVAHMFRSCGDHLIIEFVPKSDEKVGMLLQSKDDIYQWYTPEQFEKVFTSSYEVLKKELVGNSGRVLYLMKPKHDA